MNWENIIHDISIALPPTIVAAAAFWQARKTHQSVNSRMTELLRITQEAATNAATLAERKRVKRGGK